MNARIGFALIPIVLSAKLLFDGNEHEDKLCLDSNCSFGKMLRARSTARRPLCLDSNCSFGKMGNLLLAEAVGLCLDSNCSFGKI